VVPVSRRNSHQLVYGETIHNGYYSDWYANVR